MVQIFCFLRGKDNLVCGSSRGSDKLSRLIECKDDIRTHLATYHLSRESLSEYDLILARSGFFHISQQQLEQLWICPMHRHRLGKFWRESKTTCQQGPKHHNLPKIAPNPNPAAASVYSCKQSEFSQVSPRKNERPLNSSKNVCHRRKSALTNLVSRMR